MTDFKFEDPDQQTVKEAFTKLTEHERSVIARMISENHIDENTEFLKNFLIGFDKDCPFESIICQIMTQIGKNIGARLFKEVKETKIHSGSMTIKAAIEEIRQVADIIESTVQKFEETKQEH